MHPNAEQWVKKHVSRRMACMYQQELQLFLQNLWGPLFNYQYDSLKAGYPLLHLPFRTSLYLTHTELPRPLAIELIGDEIKDGISTKEEYKAYLVRGNRLVFKGWAHLRLTLEMLTDHGKECEELMAGMLRTCQRGAEVVHIEY